MLTDTEEAQVLLMLEKWDDILLKVDILEEVVLLTQWIQETSSKEPKNELRPLLIQSYQLLKLSNLEKTKPVFTTLFCKDLLWQSN